MEDFSSPELRIGDVEREEAIEVLGTHLSAGRIDITEYGDRCARASTARVRGDIAAVFADLPAPRPKFLTTPVRPVTPPPVAPARPGVPRRGRAQRNPVDRALLTVVWVVAAMIAIATRNLFILALPLALTAILRWR
ncbi:DUF1707 SHOCT-like domain-containing protein [Actinoalloteichus hymeniacidonis]|uniref:DUF1707 family protein n=1 Tax=Actinoalloteichus hymeniacidonis TaxID=340345 RepID=A0AAC9HUC6_9PSEU|nr:DUF1707 domain-containing protein [Actinoalloteichus hymeniacidonis]AOS65530.1 putative DUF1707 family protein [Actinoalloteichus hymeniacidonis]MBB5906382.1 hypothetical protein [Actinoalloteichus hymeniacidonis]